ncbi:hypothetical protein [Mycolicibacterium sp. CBMA 226]|uniref:hypothetical protein n=1 Tax=Mycolicibacterium sp. CBMA 226 TaxID=2606611 RepID=UPI00130BDCAC|nr:hypothetical protein [Mycolicibacterium sp. CBMA 226]MUL77609.1 hypothetical protein [Mycolicibacterium sp. CBMA 226]
MTATHAFSLRPCHGPAEWPELVRIWRSAVEATHDFLTADDIDFYEQNPQAVGFYHRHGFVTLSRSETDGDGRPFPILHLGPAPSAPVGRLLVSGDGAPRRQR